MELKPTAGEISNLWQFIIANQAHLCLLAYWDFHAKDEDLKKILEESKKIATKIVDDGLALYTKAGFTPPIGFSLKSDVSPEVPRLMSDKLILFILHVLSEYGIYGYGLTLGKTDHPEVLPFFETCLKNSTELYRMITETVHKKGYGHQPVYIPELKQPEMIEHHSFVSGWWGDQRQLTGIEIDNLIFSLRGVVLAKTMFMIFSQIAKDPKVKKYCRRGKNIAGKRVERFQSFNTAENLPFQATYESEITQSTISPFSDRLIMFEALSLAQIAIARYGNALSFVVRRDLSSLFGFLIVETGTFLDDGLNLMIESKWLEQPPMAARKIK
ncbi:DUF3231 family protein [Neobacillus drentensis]|uniref:DUF3231 family protein n=1 Tax=Neobacillus drentensis TaxID=220684 RepID=UPI001F2A6E25|nr:DUF3231 family protein [Neobacillus drentensis]ULT57707.1 DUF3231 family protein [Neobacillus drentensis]